MVLELQKGNSNNRISFCCFYDFPVKALLSKAIINVNMADPIMAHIIGKGFPSIFTVKKSGKPNFAASQRPM